MPVTIHDSRATVPYLIRWVIQPLMRFAINRAYQNCTKENPVFDRARLEKHVQIAPATPDFVDGVRSFDTIAQADGAEPVPVRVYVSQTQAASKSSALIWFHGGGYVTGSYNDKPNDNNCRRLCKALHCVIISVHHRRAPENPFPAASHDADTVMKWLDSDEIPSTILDLINLNSVILCGESSGGHMAMTLAYRLIKNPLKNIQITHLVLIYPSCVPENPTESSIRLKDAYLLPSYVRQYNLWCNLKDIPWDEAIQDERFTIMPAKFKLDGMPRTIIIQGDEDPLIDEVKLLEEKLTAAGVRASISVASDYLAFGFCSI